jgi:hypothetical protein
MSKSPQKGKLRLSVYQHLNFLRSRWQLLYYIYIILYFCNTLTYCFHCFTGCSCAFWYDQDGPGPCVSSGKSFTAPPGRDRPAECPMSASTVAGTAQPSARTVPIWETTCCEWRAVVTQWVPQVPGSSGPSATIGQGALLSACATKPWWTLVCR